MTRPSPWSMYTTFPARKNVVDERHHAAVRGVDRVAERAAIVDAQVAARHAAVEHPAAAELARHLGAARAQRTAACQSAACPAPCARRRAPARSRARRAPRSRSPDAAVKRGSTRRRRAPGARPLDPIGGGGGAWCGYGSLSRRVSDFPDARAITTFATTESDTSTGMAPSAWSLSLSGVDEVQGLAGHLSHNGHDRVGVPVDAIDRQASEGPTAGSARGHRKTRRLSKPASSHQRECYRESPRNKPVDQRTGPPVHRSTSPPVKCCHSCRIARY